MFNGKFYVTIPYITDYYMSDDMDVEGAQTINGIRYQTPYYDSTLGVGYEFFTKLGMNPTLVIDTEYNSDGTTTTIYHDQVASAFSIFRTISRQSIEPERRIPLANVTDKADCDTNKIRLVINNRLNEKEEYTPVISMCLYYRIWQCFKSAGFNPAYLIRNNLENRMSRALKENLFVLNETFRLMPGYEQSTGADKGLRVLYTIDENPVLETAKQLLYNKLIDLTLPEFLFTDYLTGYEPSCPEQKGGSHSKRNTKKTGSRKKKKRRPSNKRTHTKNKRKIGRK